ncbi:MAG: flavodoxin-dependent (E)-4-hydroxy-3-methylbut-2-enyl-diphosphate synthase [Pseudomonadota bacterium]|nr:flavodoxin-dependent (E)-4-hydroxy-3-methylbut-2-enyl-diphosphate synthase [Pseudomonadota bacterium]
MQYNTHMDARRPTLSVRIGNLSIGSNHSIKVQSMTNTDTSDIKSTVNQIKELYDAGSELVRITVNDDASASSVPKIKDSLERENYNLPIIGDFHYNAHILLEKYPAMAEKLDKYRINPGNIGSKGKFDQNFEKIIKIAIKHDKPVRIGGNWGSINKVELDNLINKKITNKNNISYSNLIKKSLIDSVINSAHLAQQIGLPEDKIILSCKTSNVLDLIDVYSEIAGLCKYPLHLGLTEAGMGMEAAVSSTSALSILLNKGIGDTIRVSVTPKNSQDRIEEVKICQQILSSLQIRDFTPKVISCPGCGRTTNDFFIKLSASTKDFINKKMPQWKTKYKGVESMKVAVMGCVVNGPGESKQADVGISLPGTNEDPNIPVFIKGKKVKTLNGLNVESEFFDILQDFIENNYKKL